MEGLILLKNFKLILLWEGILSLALAVLMYYVVGIRDSISLLVVPFDYIGRGLRLLSLSSATGNVIAILLYLLLSLSPIFYLFYRQKYKKIQRVDLLLLLTSILLFFILYQFINPGLMLKQVPSLLADNSILPAIKLSYAITFYALGIGYVLLRLLTSLKSQKNTNQLPYLCTCLSKILVLVSVIYTFALGYFSTFQLLKDIYNYLDKNSIPTNWNILFLITSALLEVLPVIFALVIIYSGILLLQSMINNHLKEEEAKAAEYMGSVSKNAVYVTVVSNIILNLLQLLLSSRLNDTNYQLNISFLPLIVAFSAFILSGYFKESKELQEDNEMII